MAEAAQSVRVPLDDVMLSMDVVDTLRQNEQIVERELDDETRREQLIARLREIYRGQGIEVPDRILEEGVRALAERRFVYDPPKSSLPVILARLYVKRLYWARLLGGAVLALFLVWFSWNALIVWPRAEREAAARVELGETLPRQINAAFAAVEAEAKTPIALENAKTFRDNGLEAARQGNAEAARSAIAELNALLGDLRLSFDVRIVSRPGELSGLWRIPRLNPNTRNYYLIVEAVDRTGNVLKRPVVNEETAKREDVDIWAVRVSKAAFDEIQADKLDDGIIQKAVVGAKNRGELDIRWRIDTLGGALTRW
jgi:hypothetical protein